MGCLTRYEKNKSISVFIPCSCTEEILYIEYDHELKLADCAVYSRYCRGGKLSLWQKLRYIWQVLIYSRPYADQIVLTDSQLGELKRFLIEINIK
jgi:hypothetical protein